MSQTAPALAAPAPRARKGTPPWFAAARRAAYGIGGLAIFIAIWKAALIWQWAPPGTLPDPFALPATLVQEWQSGRLLPAIGSSLVHYFWGLAAGTALGFAAGLAAATLPRFDLAQAYLARILRPIPPLAWVVFAIAWFKVSHAGAAFVIAIGVFWVNYFATYGAVRNVDPRYYELARAFGHGGYLARAGRDAAGHRPRRAGGRAHRHRPGLDDADRGRTAGRAGHGPGNERRRRRRRLRRGGGLHADHLAGLHALRPGVLGGRKQGAAMASVIEFSKLSYRHPGADAPVIQGLSLAIEAGSFVAVVGGSGVGKSTLLRAAAGLAEPAGGEVRFQAPARPGRRSRAVVFQDSRLMPWRTVGGNVGYGLEGLGLDRQERQQRIDAALQLTGLGDYGRRWPHQLSGGQAQRVGIARALAVKPDLLLMDEPFSAVDAITRRNLQQELIRVWQASGAAVLFVTHDIEEAVFLADKVVVLGGRPANIAGNYDIDLPRPRDRADPTFARQVAAIAHTLEHH